MRLNEEKLTDIDGDVAPVAGDVLQVGKRKFVRFAE